MRHALTLLTIAALTSGCHARFKKLAPTLGEVYPQVHVTNEPNVQLGGTSDGTAVGDVVAIVQAGREASLTQDLRERLDTETPAEALRAGVMDSIGSGPPFVITDEKTGSVLQIEVVDMGMEVYDIGSPGVFNYDLRVRLYRDDGKLAYKTRLHCTTDVGTPDPVAVALSTVNNAKQLKEMSDAELQAAFDTVARDCGEKLAVRMRRHAG